MTSSEPLMTAHDTSNTVLNVNDHSAARSIVSRMLRDGGVEVVETNMAAEAMQIARDPRLRPDLIVLDVVLPDGNGTEVCRELKTDSDTANIKILLTSAKFTSSYERVEGIAAGADGYLHQPFEAQELLATVRSLLRLRATELALRERGERLAESDRRKDEFLAMLGHELRNPLAAITHALPLLQLDPPRSEREARVRDVITRQTRQLSRLVDDLLEVARVSRGAIQLRRSRVDLRALVERVGAAVQASHGTARQRSIRTRLGAGALWVDADPARIEQIIVNFVDNAVKNTEPGGHIEIRLSESEESLGKVAELSVHDDGAGIDADALPRLFDTFYQINPTIDRAAGGLGLGLALVKRLAELHDGAVFAHSDGRGRGSAFGVRIPCASSQNAAGGSSKVDEGHAPRALDVLVVEDNFDSAEMLKELLGAQGHRVLLAHDGPSGVEFARRNRPDVMMVDVGLPGFDGYEVARRLRSREETRDVTLWALTGYGLPEDAKRALAAGFDAHLVKPIEIDELLRRLASAQPRSR